MMLFIIEALTLNILHMQVAALKKLNINGSLVSMMMPL